MASDINTRATYYPDLQPQAVAYDGTNIWTVHYGNNTLCKINPSDGSVSGRYTTDANPYDIVWGNNLLWVSNAKDLTLQRFNNSGVLQGTSNIPSSVDRIAFSRRNLIGINLEWFVAELGPVTVKTPNGGEVWRIGGKPAITWKHAKCLEGKTVDIKLSYDGGTSYPLTIITGVDATLDTYTWDDSGNGIPATLGGVNLLQNDLKIMIKVSGTQTLLDGGTQDDRQYDVSNNNFEIKGQVTVSSPNGSETWFVGDTNRDIVWTKKGNFDDASTPKFIFNIKLSEDGGSSYSTVIATGLKQSDFCSGDTCTWRWPTTSGKKNITAFSDAGGGKVTVTSAGHGCSNGNLVTIRNTVNYNGDYIISNVTTDTFDITKAFVATETGTFSVTDSNGVPDKIGSDRRIKVYVERTSSISAFADGGGGNITAFSDAGGGKVTVTSAGHGCSNGEVVTISGTTNYNGVYTISGVTTNTFNITHAFVATETGTFKRGTIVTSANHGCKDGESIVISGTTNYNGTYTIFSVTTNTFRITKDFVSTETGTYTTYDYDVHDESDNNFYIKGVLTITAPNGSEQWLALTDNNITWNKKGTFSTVTLKYSKNSGADYFYTIATAQPAGTTTGSYTWTVPVDAIGSAIRVKVISDQSAELQVEDASDADFSIVPSLAVTSPNTGSEIWYVGGNGTITWDLYGSMSKVHIWYSKDGGAWTRITPTGGTAADNLGGGHGSYEWNNIPDIISNNVRIRVSKLIVDDDLAPGSPYDDCDNPFKVKGKLSIIYPNGGEVFTVGTSQTIQWDAIGSALGNVAIKFARNGVDFTTVLTPEPDGVPASNESFGWDPIPDLTTSTGKIRIELISDPTAVNTQSANAFAIKGALTLLAPNGGGGQYFNVGDHTNISWSRTGTVGNVELRYSTDGGSTFPDGNIIVTGRDQDATPYDWTVPDAVSSTVRVRVAKVGDLYVSDYSDQNFSIKGSLTLTRPNGGETFYVQTSEPITWTRSSSSMGDIRLDYSINNGADGYPYSIVASYPSSSGSYSWTVADAIGSQLKVKIALLSDPDTNDVSNGVFTIKGRLSLLAPTGGETWYVGTEEDVRWNTYGTINKVNLYYSTDGGLTYPSSIATGLSNINIYTWTIPNAIDNDIRVKVENFYDTSVYTESPADFTIKGRIVLTAPNGGEIWKVGETKNVTWTPYGSIGNIEIKYSTNGGSSYDGTISASTPATNGSFPWEIPDVIGNSLKVKVTSLSDSSVSDESDTVFSIVGTLTLTSPLGGGGQTFYVGDHTNITWTKTGTLGNVELRYSTDGGSTYPDGQIIVTGIAATATPYDWTIPDAIGSQLKVKILLLSDPNNVFSASPNTFTIKGKLTLNAPNGGETWEVGTSHSITWTRTGSIENVELRYSTDGGSTYANVIIASTPAVTGSYPWSIPNDISNSVKVRVADASDTLVNDESNANFSIKGKLVLLHPNGGETLQVGSNYTIDWTTAGTITKVNLLYSTDGGTNYSSTIVTAYDNSGSYSWTVPDAIGSQVRVKVENNADTSVFDTSDANFTIKGSIDLTSPNGGETWIVDDLHNITWTKQGSIGLLDIKYSTNAGSSYDYTIATNVNSNDLTYPWTVADAIGTNLKVKVISKSDSSVSDESANVFTIKGSIRLTSPNGGESVYIGGNYDITWVKHGSIGNIKIEYSTDSGSTYPYTITTSTSSGPGTYNWTPIPDTPSTQCKIKLTCLADETVQDESDTNFRIKAVLTLTAPNGGETWIVGNTEGITWTKSGTVPQVVLEYSTNGGIVYPYSIVTTSGDALSYPWQIPDAIGNNLKVRIRNIDDSTVFDVSDNVFSIKGSLTLTYPNGGEVFAVDSGYTITWTKVGSIANVKLTYSTNGGSTYPYTIIESTPAADLSYYWTVPDTLSNTCKVMVSDASDATVKDESNGTFKIRGTLIVTSPNGTEAWSINTSHDVTWTRIGSIANVKLEYSTNGFSDETQTYLIIASTPGGQAYPWTIPDTPSSTVKVRASDASDSTVYDLSNATFRIIGSLTLTSPNGGEEWVVGNANNITWTKFGNILTVKLVYSTDGGSTYPDGNTIVASTPAGDLSYAWTIPDAITNQARVKIIDNGDPTVNDTSNANFIIKGSVTVVSPNGGENWIVGENKNITWSRTGSFANVKIEYSKNGFADENETVVITSSTPAGDLSFPWTVADAIGTNLKVRITDTANSTVSDVSNGPFNIKGSLTLNIPNGGETWVVGETRAITWSRTGSIANVKLEYSTDGGSTYPNTIIASTPASAGSYDWQVADAIGTELRVRVSDVSDATVFDTSNANFTIKGSLTLTAPNGGEEWVVATPHDITWTKTGSISTVKLEYSTNGFSDENQTYQIVASTDATGTPPGSYKYPWTIPDAISATVKVRITNNSDETVKDVSNNNFKIKGAFTLTTPNGSEKWTVGTQNSIVWSMTGTIQNAKLELSTNGGSSYTYMIVGSTPAGGLSYLWTIPDQISQTAKVKISDVSDASVYDESNANFSILGGFTISSPNGGEVWRVSDVHDITWTTTGTVNYVTLTYSTDSGETYPYSIITNTPNNNSYSWTIPDSISNSVRVKVSDAGNQDAFDTSNANFKIRGALQVTSPNNGTESWSAGSTYPITWTRTGSIATINIYYSYDNGSNWVKINANEVDASLGTWNWSIPADVILSTQALIKIVNTSDSMVFDQSDNVFQVKGGLTLNTPSLSGISMEVGNSYNITWTKFGAIGNMQIHYSTNGGIAGGGTYPDPDNLIAVVPASDLSYMWAVPDKIGTNLRIRIRDVNNFTVWDESDNPFTIKGKVTVDVPNGGETWYVGDTNQIKWTPFGTYAQVKLEYSTNAFINEQQVFSIATLPAGSSGVQQSYNWTVPDKIGVNLKVRASDNNNPDVKDISDATFIIKGKLSLTSPNGGETWVVGSNHNITWTRTGSIANVKLEYSTDGGTTYPNTIVESTDASLGSYSWTIPDAIGNGLRVRVSDVTDASVLDTSDANFTIKGSLTLTSPNGGEVWTVNSSHNITWTKTGTIANVELRYSKDGGSTYPYVIIASTPGGDLSYNWSIPDEISSTLKVKITNIADDTVFDVSDSNFKIVGAVGLVNPNGGQQLTVGTQYNITWTLTGTIANVRLEYSTDSGSSYPNMIVGSTPAGGLSYTWTIPNAVSKNVRVKVSDASDLSVYDTSDANLTIMPGFSITSPNGGETWVVASSQDITWTTTGTCSNVKLEYSINGGTDYTTIIASTPNTELYAWTVPDAISTNCKVRISDVDNPTALDITDGVFKIKGALQLSSPNGTESWDVNSKHNITWTRTGSIPSVKLEYSTNGGTTYPNLIIASVDASLGTYEWTIPDALSTQVRVKVTDTSDSTVFDTSDANFTIKGALTLNSPNGGEDLVVGNSTNITWTRFGSIQNVKLEYSTNSGQTYPNLIIAATDASTGSYNWAIPDAIGTQLRVKVSDADNSLVYDTSDANFSIKGAITVNTPNGGETWYVGESRNITWTRVGSFPTIKIEYSTNGGSTYPNVIVPSYDASLGTYPWTVPDAIGDQLRVKITDIANSTVTDTSNGNFTVKGVLQLTSPNGGETWVVNTLQNITWTRTGSIPTVKLEYSKDAGSTYPYTIVASTDASTGSYAWTVADAIGTQNRVRITDTSDSSVFDTSNANFTIKGALLLTSPNGAEAWGVATVQNITWVRTGSIANVKLNYSLDGGLTYPGVITNSTDASTGTYPWTIPDNPSTTVKVRVMDVLDESVFDISDANFKIVGFLTLTSPNNGTERWGVGLSKKITWSMIGSIANVKLEYSTNGGSSYDYLIVASTPGGGLEYYWTIPDTPSTQARVKVSDASDISVFDTSDNNFKIQARFTLGAPNGGEVWVVGDTQNITWSNIGTAPYVKLEYSTDGGANYNNTIVDSVSNTGSYSWNIPDAISAALRVKVSDVNDSEAYDTSDANFKIRGSLNLTAPNGGEVWIVNSHHNITWTKNGSIPLVKLEYSTNGGSSYPNTIVGSIDAALGTYDWTIPDAISNQVKVKVTDTSDSTVYDSSDNNFFIKGALVLTSPNGGEQWTVGTGQNITWSRTGSIANVKLEYSKNSGGTFPFEITASTDASTGSYSWAIPDDISTTLRVRITDTSDSNVSDISDADFAIKGALTLNTPNGGEIWYVGESRNITWTRVGSIPAVKLEYSTNGGASYDYVIISSTDASTGTYAWTVPDAIGSNLRVKITDTGNPVVTDTSNSNFTVKGYLTLTAPNGGETWIVGSKQNITWTPTGTIPNVKLEYSTDGGNTYPYTITPSTNGPLGSYSWTIPDAIGTNLKVRVSDAADPSVNDASNNTFSIKGSITVTAPNGGEAWGVGTDQNITWTKTGTIATVKIEYSTDGGSTYPNTIVASTDAATGVYVWNIPDAISSQLKVRITNNADTSVSDASDTNFKIVGILVLTSPNGGESWEVNTNHNITWTKTGSIANVRLDYSTNGGVTYPNTIVASTPAGALSFTWTVPDAVSKTVRVKVSDASDISVYDTSDANFTVKAQFDVTSPDGGEVWVVGSSHDITWNTIGSVTTVRIDYSTDGGATYPNEITASTANTGSFPWTIPDAISSQVRVKVSDYNNNDAFGTSGANFKIRGNITVTSPNGGEAWIVNSQHPVTWSIVGSIANVKLEYSTDGGSTYPYTIISSTPAGPGTYNWTIPDTLSQMARVKITDASDSSVYDTSDNNFKIRGNLTLTSPNGSEEWEVGSAHNVTWTRLGSIANVQLKYSIDGGSSYPYTIVASTDAAAGSYPWVIPDAITTQARVRVYDASDATVYDSSDANFKIKGVILLTAPNGSETWQVATNHNITWSITGTIANIKLEYSIDSGVTYPNLIVASVNASLGSYTWTIPDSISSQVRVKATNLSDLNVYDTSDENFNIVGQLILAVPNGGEVWPVGSSQAVTWSRVGSIANVKLEYSTNGGVSYPYLIVSSTPAASGSYNWVIPDNISQTCKVKVSDVSNANVYDVSDGNFKIRGDLVLTAPNGSEVWLINSSHDITWTRFGSIANAKLEYSKDGGVTYPYTIIGSIDASLQRYNWTIPDNPSTLVRVKISDAADSTVYDTSNGNFIIRGGFVLSAPNGGERWPVGSSQNITWNTFGSIPNVKLEYSKNAGSNWNIIVGSTPNIEVYAWTIPDAISNQCIVRVTDTNDPDANDVSDAVFKIHGVLTLTTPNGGEEWPVGSARTITWTKVGSIANVRLEYSTNGGATYPYLIADPVTASNLSYNWTIPDAISTNVKVKISDSSDLTVYDTSDGAFKIKASFSVTSPNGGEAWIVGTNYNITWNTLGTVSNVKLDYSVNGGTDWTVITNSVTNSGTYPWQIPDNISTTCRVKVSDALDSSAYDISDNNFKIRGDLIITSPNGGEKWSVGSSQVISWNRIGSIANVKLEYSDNNGITYVIITNSTPNTGSYGWQVPNAITTQALVKITNVDDSTVTDVSNAVFKIQASFTLTSPNGGEAWLVGSSHDITWTWNGTVPFVKLRYTANGGSTWNDIVTSTSNNGTYPWTVPDSVSGAVRVRVSDASDDEAYDDSNADFRIRCIFTLTSPNGAEQLRVGRLHNITWSSLGTIPNVKLVYSRDNFLTDNQVISSSAPNTGLFVWTVPDAISNTVRIRISDPNDTGAYDDSNADFRITGYFEVLSPNGGEKWGVNTTQNITWTYNGTVPEVKIEYSVDGGATFNLITATQNTGSYAWYIPDNISAQMKVRVSDLADSTAYDVSDGNAKILARFTLNTPNGGEELTVGEDYNVTWDCIGTVANVKLDYSLDNFANSILIVSSTPNDGSYTWKVPNNPSTTVKLRVMSATDSDAYDISNNNFTIVVGVLHLTQPNGSERWVTRETRAIMWDNVSGYIPKVNIEYSKDNFVSDTHIIVANLDNPAAPSSNSYNWSIPDDRSTTVKVRVSDTRDVTVNDISDNNFTIDYYSVTWQVRDLLTNANLSQLAVNATSDKGDEWKTSSMPDNPNAPLGSPVTVKLPYGFWSATWSKSGYSDMGYSFMLDGDKNLDPLFMETSAIHIWRAYSDFAYNPTTDTLTVSSWLERDGYVVSGGVRAGVYIYDGGAIIDTNPSTPPCGQDDLDNITGLPRENGVNDGNDPVADGDGIDDCIDPLLDTSPDSAGFFNSVWSPTNLVPGKVYTTITDIINASGAHFKTPSSFSITAEQKLQEMQDTVNSVLDKPISEVNTELQETLAGQTVIIQQKLDDQKTMIETKMDEQKTIIEQKTDEMITAVNTTLTSFETRTNEAITKLQTGAETAVAAGEELEATAKKFSWKAVAAPDPALTNDTITISCQGQPNLAPMLNIYSWDNKTIISNAVMTQTTPGLYVYNFTADERFTPGKAYTFIVTEFTTGGLVAGSGMVESMGITTVAGLASAAPEAERAAKKALDAIKAVEAVLTSGDNINIALTLKNLKESVDNLPEVLSKEGPSAKLTKTVNDLQDWLKTLVGNEGLDIGALMEEALSSSPTIKDMRTKTDEINQVIDILMQLFEAKFGGMDTPIISTSLQPGSVRFRIVAVNPSKVRTQKVQVKNYLPQEVTPKDVMDLGGLEMEYDSAKSIYYVYKDNVELAPSEVRIFEVEVEDIWFVPQEKLSELKSRTDSIMERLEKTEYYEKAKEIADTIYPRIEEIVTSQSDDTVSREQHIGIYRQNILVVEQIKEAIAKLEKILATAGGPLAPEMLAKTKIKAESPTKYITWVVIFIIIIFIGLLAGVLFFTWHRQTRLTREELLAAKKAAFGSGPGPEEEKDYKNQQ